MLALHGRTWSIGRKPLYLASHAYAIQGMERKVAQQLLAERNGRLDALVTPMCTRGAGATWRTWKPRDHASWPALAGTGELCYMVRTTIPATARRSRPTPTGSRRADVVPLGETHGSMRPIVRPEGAATVTNSAADSSLPYSARRCRSPIGC